MSELNTFLRQSKIKANDDTHRLKILKAVTTCDLQVDQMKSSQFHNWNIARQTAAQIKSYVLDHLPSLLEQFESKISERGAKVLWARDKDEARNYFLDIASRHQAKKIVKSKSMTTEEIEFNQLCEAHEMEVLESDLG